MTIAEFVAKHQIRATVDSAGPNPNMENSERMNHYLVRLRRGRRSMAVPFSTGAAWTREPTAEDVLGCLQSDASSIKCSRSFEEWAPDLGFDPDSRKAERTYRSVEAQTAKLRAVLGNAFDELMQCEPL